MKKPVVVTGFGCVGGSTAANLFAADFHAFREVEHLLLGGSWNFAVDLLATDL